MRFALVETEKVEAAPGLKGACPGCAAPVIARCGERKVWHWAHASKVNCDRWWETETAWHRQWKDQFPREFQEIRHRDEQTAEIHIADVLTAHGIVIEFQRSAIHPDERTAREEFYKNLVWVVDGTRLKGDYPRFVQGMNKHAKKTKMPGYFLIDHPEKCFPADWLTRSVPVIFDFKGLDPVDPADQAREGLWCLLPGRAGPIAVIVGMAANDLVSALSSRGQLLPLPYKEILALVENMRRQEIRSVMPAVRNVRLRGQRNRRF